MEREWRPARSTFANTLLALIKYLGEHDPQPGGGSQREAERDLPVAGGGTETDPNLGGGFWAMMHPRRF